MENQMAETVPKLRMCDGCIEQVELACGRYQRWAAKLMFDTQGVLHFQMNAKTDVLCERYGGAPHTFVERSFRGEVTS